jgi:hypothetical protein
MDLPGLNFQSGIGVQAVVQCPYGESIYHAPGLVPMEFFLLVSVGRCKYRVSEHSVCFLLQATLGGCTVDFKPLQIAARVFRFFVASKNVGFHIYKLRSFSCDQYQIFFNLWGNGGAHWTSELEKFYKKEQDQWQVVHRRNFKLKKSFADIVRNQPKLSGANRVSIRSMNFQNSNPLRTRSVFDRISWPREMYHNWGSRSVNRPSTHWESVKSRDSYHEPAKRFASQGNWGFLNFQILNS